MKSFTKSPRQSDSSEKNFLVYGIDYNRYNVELYHFDLIACDKGTLFFSVLFGFKRFLKSFTVFSGSRFESVHAIFDKKKF